MVRILPLVGLLAGCGQPFALAIRKGLAQGVDDLVQAERDHHAEHGEYLMCGGLVPSGIAARDPPAWWSQHPDSDCFAMLGFSGFVGYGLYALVDLDDELWVLGIADSDADGAPAVYRGNVRTGSRAEWMTDPAVF